jgi:hypothetical protein
MIGSSTFRFTRVILAAALLLTLGGVLAGCGKSASTKSAPTSSGPTAKESLPIAQAALATTAPDAKLLVAETANVVTATSTPVWEYLFGSPKDDKVYAVVVDKGKATSSEYGTAGLSATEWAAVPNSDAWKVDSPAAYKTALENFPKGNASSPYAMRIVIYVPKSATTSTVKPMDWTVYFNPMETTGVPTGTVDVNGTTGAVVK